ncbi:cysteine-rich secretory protein 2-like [Halichoeres trimaculatus]|uniref:cysteine-rich secretory protein 2-like n=1 Tax=Halichoeres trimaculatus TaxID=147232 RepID=UPI003D9ED7FD
MRANVDPPASNMLYMNWSNSAEKTAQNWANQCDVEHSEHMFRIIDDKTICGENLFMSSRELTWTEIITTWYNERNGWVYGLGPIGPAMVGHYTQLVNYKSHKLGCAVSYCPNDPDYRYFYVCHYCPQGNHDLGKPYNTGSNCAECPNDCKNKLCLTACPHDDGYYNCPYFKNWCFYPPLAEACPATCKCAGNQIK